MGAWDFGPYRLKYPRMGKLSTRREATFDEKRQFFAVESIHKELELRGLDPGSNPWYSWDTYKAVRRYQNSSSDLNIDGCVGRTTYTSLIKHAVFSEEEMKSIPGHYLAGMVVNESGFDPVAIGYIDPNDRGLVQINRVHHPDVTDAEAFDPYFALNWGAERMRKAYNLFLTVNPEVAWECAIAYHNNPTKAREWAETGSAPDEQIAGYVSKIKTYGAQF